MAMYGPASSLAAPTANAKWRRNGFAPPGKASTVGAFEITQQIADDMFHQHIPHGKPNSDVIRRWKIGRDINQRSRNMLIIDFGTDMTEDCAALYEAPFEYVRANVKPKRIENRMRRRADGGGYTVQPLLKCARRGRAYQDI